MMGRFQRSRHHPKPDPAYFPSSAALAPQPSLGSSGELTLPAEPDECLVCPSDATEQARRACSTPTLALALAVTPIPAPSRRASSCCPSRAPRLPLSGAATAPCTCAAPRPTAASATGACC